MTTDQSGETRNPYVQRLEAERLNRIPPGPGTSEPIDVLFTQLLDLIAAECRRGGMLPRRVRRAPGDIPDTAA